MEDDLKKNRKWKTTSKKMEVELKKWKTTSTKNGRRPQTQFTQSTLNGCDTIVN